MLLTYFSRVKTSYGEGRYVGDEAAAWISTYLEKPGCKIYQLSKTRVIEEDQKWGNVAQPGDMVLYCTLFYNTGFLEHT